MPTSTAPHSISPHGDEDQPDVTFTGAPGSAGTGATFIVASNDQQLGQPGLHGKRRLLEPRHDLHHDQRDGELRLDRDWLAMTTTTGPAGARTTTALQINLTIAGNNKTKQYSDPVPPLDVTYSGFVPGRCRVLGRR